MPNVSLNTLSAIYNYVKLAKKLQATSGEVAVRDSRKMIDNALNLTAAKCGAKTQQNFESDIQFLHQYLEEEIHKRKLHINVLE